MRDKIFAAVAAEWKEAYDAGIFTEFMEQRAPGHTVLDGKIYRGLLDFQEEIARAIAALDFLGRPGGLRQARAAAGDANLLRRGDSFRRASRRAGPRAGRRRDGSGPQGANWRRSPPSAAACRPMPPRDFHEALQAYWFCHLAVITELNGWDSFSPGHLDQHLLPFYERGLADGTLDPRVGPGAAGGLLRQVQQPHRAAQGRRDGRGERHLHRFRQHQSRRLLADGSDGSNEVSHLLLDVIDEMHLLQPSSNLQLSRKTPEALLKQALRVVRNGYGFPSIFNADAVVEEQLRQGKTLEDARAGGCSGCVETGAFGKEAFILTGYFNLVKILELALHDGIDPRTGQRLGPRTGRPGSLASVRRSVRGVPPAAAALPRASRSAATSSSSRCTPR